jgi:hypothetical protein
MSRSKLRVLHVLEATLGGTRRYIEDIAVTTADAPLEQGLVYGTSRSDSAFGPFLERVRETGWFLAPIDVMRRPVNAMNDARAVAQVRRRIGDFRPHVLHVHSAKGVSSSAAKTRSAAIYDESKREGSACGLYTTRGAPNPRSNVARRPIAPQRLESRGLSMQCEQRHPFLSSEPNYAAWQMPRDALAKLDLRRLSG